MGKILWHYARPLLHTLATCISWILATVSNSVLYVWGQPPWGGQKKVLYIFCVTLNISRNSNSLAEPPFAHSQLVLSTQTKTIFWDFLVATDPLRYFKRLCIDHVRTCSRIHLSMPYKGTFAQAIVHSSTFTMFIVVSTSCPLVWFGRLWKETKTANIDRFHCTYLKTVDINDE